ncbi:hypothetical protein E2562_003164 [Oryza meyeriana var. granulata]|uniref:Uncharacterized protein n=1 Tax=Oryza meyeriana var. granulata TaxID=110450 RepID=A0A6G1EUU7_9ORYZ|nr:hypothetical protein E2562_003164 [Oryza meyeriana var. granulata]
MSAATGVLPMEHRCRAPHEGRCHPEIKGEGERDLASSSSSSRILARLHRVLTGNCTGDVLLARPRVQGARGFAGTVRER